MRIVLPVIFLALSLAACSATGPASVPAGYGSIDQRYSPLLGREYQAMATLMQANSRGDLARRFADKASAADAGQWPYPETPGGDPEMARAYNDLNGALMTAMTPANAEWLAKAQVSYDCWAAGANDDGCRRNFEKIMRSVLLPVTLPPVPPVYFADDSSVLSNDAYASLETVAGQMRMNKTVALHLTGRSGGGEQNQSLALRRAIAVRNVLTQMGVDPDRIAVDDESHSDTILSRQTEEGGTDPRDHRVDIVFEQGFGYGY